MKDPTVFILGWFIINWFLSNPTFIQFKRQVSFGKKLTTIVRSDDLPQFIQLRLNVFWMHEKMQLVELDMSSFHIDTCSYRLFNFRDDQFLDQTGSYNETL